MKAVIFDLDDTLYPYIQHVHSGFAAVATYVDRHFRVPARDAYATLRFARELDARGSEFQRLCDVHRLDQAIVPALLKPGNDWFHIIRIILKLRCCGTQLNAFVKSPQARELGRVPIFEVFFF